MEDISREQHLASNINAGYIESIPLYQVASLLEISTSLPHGPSIQAVRLNAVKYYHTYYHVAYITL